MIPRRSIASLKNIHTGETAWIVGKGPSLLNLQAEHFGDGPVITINAAIVTVQALGLPNPLYAMQKDGCHWQPCVCKPRGELPAVVELHESTTLILQRPGFSELCFPLHAKAVYVRPETELNLPAPAMSIRMCAAIARLMGCREIVFVCCDSLVTGDIRRVDFHTQTVVQDAACAHYLPNNPRLLKDLGRFPFRTLLPEGETA